MLHTLDIEIAGGDIVRFWRCENCSERRPIHRRAVPAADHRTPSQQRWLDRIAADFGGTIEVKRIGRSVFVIARNDARNWIAEGCHLSGTITDAGHVRLTLSRALVGDVEITARNWSAYVPVARPTAATTNP